MVIVETIALSTMVCNDLVMPVLLRMRSLRLTERRDLTGLLLGIRRGAIVRDPAARLPVLPARRRSLRAGRRSASSRSPRSRSSRRRSWAESSGRAATRRGALAGLGAGFAVWLYTLLLPSLRQVGLAADRLPRATARSASRCSSRTSCSGLTGLDQITHAMIWSMIANIGAYVAVSVLDAARAPRNSAQASAASSTSSSTATTGSARASGAAPPRCRT